MSIDFNSWLAGGSSIVQAQKPLRAAVQAARIADKPVSITIRRGGVDLPPQTVRIEWTDAVSSVDSDLGEAAVRRGYIIHHKDHATLPDLDIQEWDVFVLKDLDKNEYTVKSINHHLVGQIQAFFESV
jgi:hypothetical protein